MYRKYLHLAAKEVSGSKSAMELSVDALRTKSMKLLDRLSHSPSSVVRRGAAMNRHATAAMLHRLSLDETRGVRQAAYANPNIASGTLEEAYIREKEIITRSGVNFAVLGGHQPTFEAIIGNKNCPEWIKTDFFARVGDE